MKEYYSKDETLALIHHGIKGQKWGVRRFQNPDGTLTVAGINRIQRKIEKQESKNKKKSRFIEQLHG